MDDTPCICTLLASAASAAERTICKGLHRTELTHCQVKMLRAIAGGATSMSALSELLSCHKSNVTQVVQGLVRRGLVQREQATTDRRTWRLLLTQQGEKSLRTAEACRSAQIAACSSMFTSEERCTLSRILRPFIDRLSGPPAPSGRRGERSSPQRRPRGGAS